MEEEKVSENKINKKIQDSGIMRMTAHQYEKKINELLEKIEILESRLLLLNTQKGYAVTKLKDYEEKNEKLSKNYDDKMKENQKLKEIKKNNEEEINNLKKSNKIFTQRNKERFADINKDLENKSKKIDNLNKEISQKNEKIRALSLNHKLNQNERDVTQKELDEQKKINKQQNKLISDLQKQLDVVNIHKKNEGALSLEIDHLKQDNIRLLEMMKESSDPKIRNFAFLDNSSSGGIIFIRPGTNKNRAKSTESYNMYKSYREINARKSRDSWIPLEAYECAMEFKNKYNLDLTDIEIEQLLSSLNKIWQDKLKREINNVKAKYHNEIKDLRTKLNMKSSFNEFDLKKKNENLKQNLMITRDTLRDNIIMKHKMKEEAEDTDKLKNLFRTNTNFRKNKACYLNENERLKKKLKENSEYNHYNDYHNGALFMALKTCEEMNKCEKNINELFGIYEDKVKNSIYNNESDYLYRNKIMDNSVNWLVKNLKDSLYETKTKMAEWKNDEQRNLNSIGLSMKNIN